MKQVCLLCGRTSLDSNLYCQEIYCPAEMSPIVLDYGEWLGDIEIIKPVIVLRSAVLYQARHQKKKVFLKVAHPGAENTERLKREAEFLKSLQLENKQREFLPVLLPPYANTTIQVDAYGKAMLRSHLLYFYLFEFANGEPLRDVLQKNPQLWINHVGWLMMNLASAVAILQGKGLFHFGLSPDSVLVRFEENPNVPRILLFDLGIVSDAQNLHSNWYLFFVPPTYTAPELINGQMARPEYATDVYGLGLTLYELLVGEPPFPHRLQSDNEVYRAVQRNRRVRMNRVEDVKPVADIALQAVDQQVARRQQSAAEMVEQLLAYFGQVPGKKQRRLPSLNTILIIVGATLAIAFLIALAVSLSEWSIFAQQGPP